MSDLIGIAMEILLAVLLVAALMYGMRLEKKLKALRDSQAGFAEAVLKLDAAAMRAQAGLENLRQAADETHDALHDRILKARELKQDLDKLIARAERVASSAAPAPGPQAPPAPAAQPDPVRGIEGLKFLAETAATAEPARAPARPQPASQRQAQPQRRAAHNLDEDLFASSGENR